MIQNGQAATENDQYRPIILTLILLVPLAGAILIALLPDRAKLPNWIALATTLVTFLLTLHLPAHFITGQSGFQFERNIPWIENPAIFYHVGVDGLSLWLVVLVGLLAPIGVVASWNAIQTRRKVFYSLFLVQQTAMFGVFISLDLMLYYGFWELSLVPMAILIAMYGRKDGPAPRSNSSSSPSSPPRRCWSRFSGSTRTPAPSTSPTCNSKSPAAFFPPARSSGSRSHSSSPSRSRFLSFRFMAGSPTPTAKRPSLSPWSSPASSASTPCFASTSDFSPRSPAPSRHCSSLSPSSEFSTAPVSLSSSAISGDSWPSPRSATSRSSSSPSTASHSSAGPAASIRSSPTASSMARFSCSSARSKLRYATSLIDSYGGLAAKLPRAATYFVIASLAMIGLPMLSGFIGEFIILSSTFAGVSRPWAVAATVAVILGAAYMLSLVQRIFYGPESTLTASKPSADLRFGELAILTPLVILMLVMGVAPNLWLNTIRTGVHPPQEASQQQASQPPSPTSQTSVILSGSRAAAAVEGPATKAVILSDRSMQRAGDVEGPAVAFSNAGANNHQPLPGSEAQR